MRNRAAERAMLREVHLRNLIAKFQDLNGREYGQAIIPEVGLFWMSCDGELFFKSSVSIRDAEDYGDFRIYGRSHYEDWGKAVRENPDWEGMAYEEVPRGRVVLSMVPRRSRFIVYLPKVLKRYEEKIAQAFVLPSSHAVYDYADEHYRPLTGEA